jgi:DNA replication and repair protein RecF
MMPWGALLKNCTNEWKSPKMMFLIKNIMSLQRFNATNFRNFTNIELDLKDNFNIFYGQNGSGKTSILEAIYYLSFGRSFRTHLLSRVIKSGATSFSIFGEIYDAANTFSIPVPIGIVKSANVEENKIRIAGENVKSKAELATLLPILLLNQDTFQLLDSGPKFRRKFIDWGVFHVEQNYLPLWKRVNHVLLQRNAVLQAANKMEEIKHWDEELVSLNYAIHDHRNEYINKLLLVVNDLLHKFLGDYDISLAYYPGWDIDVDLKQVMLDDILRDKQLGYTQHGFQRADLKMKIGKVPVQDFLSRGQQKLFFFILLLAQGILLHTLAGKKSIYLIDDFYAELDVVTRQLLLKIMREQQNAQFVLTSLQNDGLISEYFGKDLAMFHVERGKIL